MGMRDLIAKAILGGKVGGVHPGGIHTYHSSPHDFDRFDWSKLRSGEGANVYGAGFYSAESPKVSGQGGEYWQNFLHKFPATEAEAAGLLRGHAFDREKAIAANEQQIRHARSLLAEKPDNASYQRNLQNALERRDVLEGGAPIGPRTYELNLRVKPDELLDWDKPLREQSGMIDALSGSRRKAVREALQRQDYAAPTRTSYGTDIGPVTGKDYYNMLSLNLGGRSVDPKASELLAASGVPGIRYLDQGSRPVGQAATLINQHGNREAALKAVQQQVLQSPSLDETMRLAGVIEQLQKPQTYNYVMFDPSKIDIMAKYGVVGGVPVGMGALAAQDQYGAQQ